MPKMARFVEIDAATGAVCADWRGDAAAVPVPPPGRIFIEVPLHDGVDFSRKRWTWTEFVAVRTTPPVTQLDRIEAMLTTLLAR